MIENISAVVITKNTSETIGVTLDSLLDFKEVVVYDSGSVDNTLDIVSNYPNVVLFKGDFLGFGPTKNYAISLASNDWVLSLDADESLSKELTQNLAEIMLLPRLIGEIRRDNYFIGKEIRVAGWGRDKLIRLFNKTEFSFSTLMVHEKVEIDSSAKKTTLKGSIIHNAITRLSQTLDKANLYSELYAEQNSTSHPLWIIFIKANYSFFRTYILQLGFLAGWRGLVISFANSVGVFYKYVKVYVRHNQRHIK